MASQAEKIGPYHHPAPPWVGSLAMCGVLPVALLTACISAVVITINTGSKKNLFAFITTQVALCDFLMACGPIVFFILLVSGTMENILNESHSYGCLTAVVFSYTTVDISACMLLMYVVAAYYRIYYINTSWYQTQITKKKVQLASHLMFVIVPVIDMYFLNTSPAVITDMCHSLLPAALHGHPNMTLSCLVFAWIGLALCGFPIIHSSDLFNQVMCRVQHSGSVDRELSKSVKCRPQAFEPHKYLKVPLRFYKLRLDDVQEEEPATHDPLRNVSAEEVDRAWASSRERLPIEELNSKLASLVLGRYDIASVKQEPSKKKRMWWTSPEESHRMVLANVLESSSTSRSATTDDKSSLSENRESGQSRASFLINLLHTSEGRLVADGLRPTISLEKAPPVGNFQDLKNVSETSADEDSTKRRRHVYTSLSRSSVRSGLGSMSSQGISIQRLSGEIVLQAEQTEDVEAGVEKEGETENVETVAEKEGGMEDTKFPPPLDTQGGVSEVEGATSEKGSRRDRILESSSLTSFSTFEMRFNNRDLQRSHRAARSAISPPPVIQRDGDDGPTKTHSGFGCVDQDVTASFEGRTSISYTLSDSNLLEEQNSLKKVNKDPGALISLEVKAHAPGYGTGRRSNRSTQTLLRASLPVVGANDVGSRRRGKRASFGGSHSSKHDTSHGGPSSHTAEKDQESAAMVTCLDAPTNNVRDKHQSLKSESKNDPKAACLKDSPSPCVGAKVRPLVKDGPSLPPRRGRKYRGRGPVELRSDLIGRSPSGVGGLHIVLSKDASLSGAPANFPWELIRHRRVERQKRLISKLRQGQALPSPGDLENNGQQQQAGPVATGPESSGEDSSASQLASQLKQHFDKYDGSKGFRNRVTDTTGCGDGTKNGGEKQGPPKPSKLSLRRSTSSSSNSNSETILGGSGLTVTKRGRAAFWRLVLFVTVITALWLPQALYVKMSAESPPIFLQPLDAWLLILSWCRPLASSALLLWSTCVEG